MFCFYLFVLESGDCSDFKLESRQLHAYELYLSAYQVNIDIIVQF